MFVDKDRVLPIRAAALPLILLLLWFGLAVTPTQAQTPPPLPTLPPAYQIDDVAQWPSADGAGTFAARLIGVSAPGSFTFGVGTTLWIADGLPERGLEAAQMVDRLASSFYVIRQRDFYRAPALVPGFGEVINPGDLLPVPDADFNGSLAVIFVPALPDDAESLLATDGGERIYLSYAAFRDLDSTEAVFAALRAYFDLILTEENPDIPAWVAETWFGQRTIPAEALIELIREYLNDVSVPLLTDATDAGRGGRVLFFDYLESRYGAPIARALLGGTGEGLAPLDQALIAAEAYDPTLGATPTGLEVYADFMTAVAVNFAIGDGRYQLTSIGSQDGAGPRAAAERVTRLPHTVDATLPPFGSRIVQYTSANGGDVRLSFDGGADGRWLVQVFTTGTPTEPPRVRRWFDPAAQPADGGVTGEQVAALGRQETIVIIISAVGAADAAPFTFTLETDS